MLTNCQFYAAKVAPNPNRHTFGIVFTNRLQYSKLKVSTLIEGIHTLESIKPHYKQTMHFKKLRDI